MTEPPGTIVVALGGNALAPGGAQATIHEQFEHTRQSLSVVVALARAGWRIVMVHGNGPQVGDALERNEISRDVVAPLPLGVLVAATLGWIGYMIQQSLQNALRREGIPRDVITLVTQTVVDRADPNLRVSSKPIGHELTPALLEQMRARNVPVVQDTRGRWRRMAPSPAPLDVVEAECVEQLVAEGKIVVACGGGGPPVFRDDGGSWEGVDAVVDKDRAAAVLARRIGATVLLILTDVDAVYRGWGTAAAARVARLSVDEAEAFLAEEELGSGSMRPKIEAGLDFVRGGGERAVIGRLDQGLEALSGRSGTTIMGAG